MDSLNIPSSVLYDMFNVSTALYGANGEEVSGDYIVKWSYFEVLSLEISVRNIDDFE